MTSNFPKISTFWNALTRMKFGTPLEGLKRMDEFVNQPFFTNGSGFIHKKSICKNQKFNFPA